jgi:redox-sensitive bicupin YhaK (pirin superfamily)
MAGSMPATISVSPTIMSRPHGLGRHSRLERRPNRARSGFRRIPHRDMEIITYVRTGAISTPGLNGKSGPHRRRQSQDDSAGSGVTHAEYNLEGEETTLFQIWLRRQAGNAAKLGE